MLTAEVAETAAGSLAFSSLVHIEHAGHSVPGDNPEAFEKAVRNFLGSTELPKSEEWSEDIV